jgi:branched-chain amino acid transport system permease protein
MLSWALFAAFLLILPFLIGRTLSDVAVQVGLFVLMGFGLNIAIGLAGLLDLGYVTNYAVGAYVMAVLTSTGPFGQVDGLTFWMVIPLALLAAMFAGFFFAMPVLKMRGDYLAIATLGFGEIIGKLAISDWFKPTIGGAQGVLQVPKPEFFGTALKNPEQLYYIVLAACVITLFVSIRINNSRTGRQWMAIREDEDVAAAMGINVAKAKLLAFTISAATGGVAGAIFAAKVGTVFPTSFTVFVSINVLSLIIVGGMGSNPGIVLGAIVLIGMPELLREFSEYRFLIYGALLVFMMVNRPEGLWPSKVRQREIQKDADILQPSAVAAGD